MPADGRTDIQTDRHDEANGRFSQFCKRPNGVLVVGNTYSVLAANIAMTNVILQW